jgi:signal transduction histidine kinase
MLNPQPVTETNMNGDILFSNPAAKKLFPGLKKSGIDHPWLTNWSEITNLCQDNKERNFNREVEINKRWYYQSIHFVPRTQCVRIYGHDITERKNIEKAKDEFFSLASHQLRTPLANIRLSSELMLRGITGENSPEQKGFLEEIQKATKKMGILISNLLNVSRMEMGNFDIKEEAMDIGSVAGSIVKDFAPLVTEKGISYSISTDPNLPVIYFDENVLHIIIENLISNSLRYTPKGGSIDFRLRKQNDHILIEVSDTGCGISGDQKEAVFKKSFRTNKAKSITSEGVGLGLYMVKSVCDKIGAKIWFESKPEKETTFYVSLPIKEEL